MMIRLQYTFLIFFFTSSFLAKSAENSGRFIKNEGQWEKNILYKVELATGAFFIEKNGYTVNLSQIPLHGVDAKSHKKHEGCNHFTDDKRMGHAVKMHFKASSVQAFFKGENPWKDYYNFYQSSNPSEWKTNVSVYKNVKGTGIYEGINWIINAQGKGIKHDFIVAPGANPLLIRMVFEGHDKLEIRQEQLIIKTSLGEWKEDAPIAWQIIDGETIPVKCTFELSQNEVSFKLGKYDSRYELIIDPQLDFGTYSGSTSDNWGFTATYDNEGNTYSGGVVYGTGYPVSVGAYQITFAGGSGSRASDIAIMKYDRNGQRLYSSYLGGASNEVPQSMIVSNANELFIFGTTGSADFPTTYNAYNKVFSGGENISVNGTNFPLGTDMFICRFSPNGNQLLASTLIGGSKNDGVNTSFALKYNYADEFRGSIILDNLNNVYIGSSTSSEDFPVPGNAFQPQFGGGIQDGIVLKMNENLSTLFFGSFLGGSGDDGIYTLTLDKQSNIFVSGGTQSTNYPVTNQAYQSNYGGGRSDGFIAKVSSNGQQLMASTYYGSDQYDQVYFVETDRQNNVFVLGQTEKNGNFYRANFQFGEANGKHFISKFNPDLSQREFSTVFGTGRSKPDISPSAFTVDICGQIFISGWGGGVNAIVGTTQGLTVTTDAFQSTTDNNDFYLLVLDEPAESLVYATFFGGSQSSEHVDGGTSRFDKKGIIYQAVCAGCGGFDDFPTTPGVWSNQNPTSGGCNNAVFKFDFQLPSTLARFTTSPIGCAPFEVNLNNTSLFAESYEWFLNNTSFSVADSPVFTLDAPGQYTIKLVASNPNSCNLRDTFFQTIRVVNSTYDEADPLEICLLSNTSIGPEFPINPYYQVNWFPETGLSNAAIQRPLASPDESITYTLYLSLETCSDTLVQSVIVREDSIDAGPNLEICRGQEVEIGLPGNNDQYTYAWEPASLVNNANLSNPLVNIDESTTFTLLRIPKNNTTVCPGKDTLHVHIPPGSPLAQFTTELTASCTEVYVSISNTSEFASTHQWDFGLGSGNQEIEPKITYAYGDSIIITLIVENEFCRDTLTYIQPLSALESYFKMNNSNAFSPNGDGLNDCFSPAMQDLPSPEDKNFLPCTSLYIYDRWGKPIFEAIEIVDGCWDGTNAAGEEMPDGVYFYLFKGQGKEVQGSVSLLR